MLALFLCLALLSGCSTQKKLVLATGETTGTYYSYGSAIAMILSDRSDVKMTVSSTSGSRANIALLKNGDADLAIVQNDVAYYAYTGTDLMQEEAEYADLRTIGALYPEVVHIVARKSVTSIDQLAGLTVSVGENGSGTEFNARQVLEAYGISFDDIHVVNLGFSSSADALKSGQIDAFFAVSGSPATYIANLAEIYDFNLLSVDETHYRDLVNQYGFYVLETIPAGTYKNIRSDTQTLAVKAVLVADKSVKADTVYAFLEALFENREELETAHVKGALLSENEILNGISTPLHEGALRYYEDIGLDISMFD